HNVAEASLHGIKFRGGDDVFLASRKNARDFFLRVADALRRWRMRGEGLRDGAGTALLVGLDALEESYVGVRIVAGLVHILNAKKIRFAFGVARELEEGQGNRQIHALI